MVRNGKKGTALTPSVDLLEFKSDVLVQVTYKTSVDIYFVL